MNIIKFSKFTRLAGLILAVGYIASLSTFAQTTSWNAASGGLWDSGNWDNGVPDAGYTVNITNNGSKTITINDTVDADSLSINALTIGGATLAGSYSTLHLLSGLTNTPLKITATTGYGLTIKGTGDDGTGSLILDGRDIEVKDSAVQIGSTGVYDTIAYLHSGKIVTKDLRVTGTGTSHADLFVDGGELDISDINGNGLRVAFTENSNATLTVTSGIVKIRSAVIGASGTTPTNKAAQARMIVTGSNSVLQLSNDISILSRATGNEGLPGGLGTGELSIEDGAILQLTKTTSAIGIAGGNSIARIKNAVISYKDVALDIDPEYKDLIPRLTLEGSNALRLDNSKNRTSTLDGVTKYKDYTMGAGHIYQGLQLTGLAPKWNGDTLTIDDQGSFWAFDSSDARMGAALSNAGLLKVTNGVAIFEKNVALGATGTIQGSSGELQFYKDLTIGITALGTSNLTDLNFRFTNGTTHTLDLENSTFLDDGDVVGNALKLSSLTIDQGDSLTLLGTAGINALYISLLDLDGRDIGAGLNASLINALNLGDGVNIYYDSTLAGNAYLNSETYDLWGGNGQLIAVIPEVSSIHLLLICLVATSLLAWRKRRNA